MHKVGRSSSKPHFSPTSSATLLIQPNRAPEQLAPLRNDKPESTSFGTPWATTDVMDAKGNKTVVVSEAHSAQLDRVDPHRFDYFYQKHLNKMHPKTGQQQQQTQEIATGANQYQIGPSKFFGEYDNLKRSAIKERLEQEAKEATATAESQKGLSKNPLVLPPYRSSKKQFAQSGLSHVMDKRSDFLRQLTDEELALVVKASVATGEKERVLDTMISPLGARAGLQQAKPGPSTTEEGLSGATAHQTHRVGPRIVSEDFKNQLKDRKHFQTLQFDKSNAFTAPQFLSDEEEKRFVDRRSGTPPLPNAKGHHDTKYRPKNQFEEGDEKPSAVAGGEITSSKVAPMLSLSKRIIQHDAEVKAKQIASKNTANAQLRKDLEQQRLRQTQQSPMNDYFGKMKTQDVQEIEFATKIRNSSGRCETPLLEQKYRGENRPHDTTAFESAVSRHRFNRKKIDNSANGVTANVIGGAEWGEDAQDATKKAKHDKYAKYSLNNPRLLRPLEPSKAHEQQQQPSTKIDVAKRTKDSQPITGKAARPSISPSTLAAIDKRVRAIASEEADSMRFGKQLLSTINDWDQGRK